MYWILILFFISTLPCSVYAVFEHDKASYAGQQQLWPAALDLMKKTVAQHPTDAHVLYDTGVASYRVGDYTQAQAYLHQAAIAAQDPVLQERAYFNEGNAQAHNKHYQEAIDSYEKVLTLNPDNQQARDNLALVKKLLQQQKQEQQNDQKKDDQKNQDKQDNKKNQDQKKDNNDHDKENSDDADNNDEGDGDPSKDDGDDHSDDKKRGDKDDEDNATGSNEQQQEKQRSSQQRQDMNKPHQSSGSEQQPSSDQKESPATQAREGKGEQSTAEGMQQKPTQEVAPWLESMLSDREQQDAALQKALMRMQAAQQPQGHKNARSNW